jgi:hypothetical protein
MVKIKGGMTVTVPIASGNDIIPGTILEYHADGYVLATSTVAVDATNVVNYVVALDYDESGDGYIGAVPVYGNFRVEGLTGLVKGELVVINDGVFKTETAADADDYIVIGYATSATSLTTEIGGNTVTVE